MFHKTGKKKCDNSTRASVKEEMAKPRITKSARIAEQSLDRARIPERSSTTLPGTVENIIPASHPSQREEAQIAMKGSDRRYQNLRIENILTDENGEDVRPKKGAHVEVTITAEPKKPG
jgi:hypothetical protein